jgi:hypothetical protein
MVSATLSARRPAAGPARPLLAFLAALALIVLTAAAPGAAPAAAQEPAPPEASADAAAPPEASAAEAAAPPEAPAAEAAAPPAPPKLVIDAWEYNAGAVKAASSISHDFAISNAGGEELVISEVVPGCGCSVATFTTNIPPGGEGVVTLTVEIYPEWAGHDVNKMAVILSNDPEQPLAKLSMVANVLPE